MGNINQREGTNYGYLMGPNGIIMNDRPRPDPPAEKPTIVEEPQIVKEVPVMERLPAENLPQHCAFCEKKLSIVNQFKCRCENIYCIKHLHSFNHKCTFDYKKLNKEQLEKSLSVPEKKKLQEI